MPHARRACVLGHFRSLMALRPLDPPVRAFFLASVGGPFNLVLLGRGTIATSATNGNSLNPKVAVFLAYHLANCGFIAQFSNASRPTRSKWRAPSTMLWEDRHV